MTTPVVSRLFCALWSNYRIHGCLIKQTIRGKCISNKRLCVCVCGEGKGAQQREDGKTSLSPKD